MKENVGFLPPFLNIYQKLHYMARWDVDFSHSSLNIILLSGQENENEENAM